MQNKRLWLPLLSLLFTLTIGAGTNISTAHAAPHKQESANYNVMLNSWAGGNYSGSTTQSASYMLIISTGGKIDTSTASAGYQLCTGFICQADKGFFQMRLPALAKSPGD